MDQAIWLLRSAYAAVGCALRSAHPNAEQVSSLCSAHAAAGCVLLSSHTPPLHLRCKFLVPWEQMACLRPILQLRMQSDADRCYIAVIQLPRRVSPAAGCRASFCWRSPPCRWTQPCQVVEFNYQFMPDGT